jgi:predicted RNA methylase
MDKSLNIRTDEWHRTKDTSLCRDACEYIPTTYDKLNEIFGYLGLSDRDIFVDLGCGMGRAVLLAATKKIKKSVGVELDPDLVADAAENLRRARGLISPVEFINADAAAFEIKEGTIFFLYNPFGCRTIVRVADNIRKFLENSRGAARIVYFGPQYRHVFEDAPWLELEKELSGNDTVIWRSRAPADKLKI